MVVWWGEAEFWEVGGVGCVGGYDGHYEGDRSAHDGQGCTAEEDELADRFLDFGVDAGRTSCSWSVDAVQDGLPPRLPAPPAERPKIIHPLVAPPKARQQSLLLQPHRQAPPRLHPPPQTP